MENVDRSNETAVTAAPAPSLVGFVITTLVHLLLGLPIVATVLFKPRLERIYREFALKLPALTEWTLDGGLSALLLAMILLLMVDAPMRYFLTRAQGRRKLRVTWSALVILVLLSLGLVANGGLWLPLLLLHEGLQR